jgi:ABC-type branched-subunit amino acid transport system substrate-binding protein
MTRLPSLRRPLLMFGASALILFLLAACTVTPPTIKVEVAGGAGEQASTTTEGSTQVQPGTAPGPAEGGENTGTLSQVNASSAAAAAAASANCKPAATNERGISPTEIKVGSTFARSGPVANISGPIEQGVRAYFNEVNANKGICGRKLNLVGYDDGWNPQEGKRLLLKLADDDKVALLAVVPSSLGLDAARDDLESRGIPVFGTSGLIESQFKEPLQWPVGASTGLSSPHVAIPYLVKERGIKQFAVIYLSDLEVGRLAEAAIKKEAAANGATVCASEPRVLSDTQYGSTWASIYSKCGTGPEYVFFALDPSGIIKAAKQASKRPTKGWGSGPPGFLDLVPQQVGSTLSQGESVYESQSPYYPPIDPFLTLPGVQAYAKTVQKYYGTQIDLKNPYLEGGYCGAAMVTEVIRQSGPAPTRAKIIAAGNNLTTWSCGVSLPMTFRGGNHYGNKGFIGVKLQFSGGAWKWIPATCTTPGDSCWRQDSKPGQE